MSWGYEEEARSLKIVGKGGKYVDITKLMMTLSAMNYGTKGTTAKFS